jgi:hypothetical protein
VARFCNGTRAWKKAALPHLGSVRLFGARVRVIMRRIALAALVSAIACWPIACRRAEPQTVGKPSTAPASIDAPLDTSTGDASIESGADQEAEDAGEDTEGEDYYPFEPANALGVTRDVPGWRGPQKCQILIGVMPKAGPEVETWTKAQERSAYGYARLLCSTGVAPLALTLVCRTNAPRDRLVGVACNKWPQKFGNANPTSTFALFERTKDRVVRLGERDLFTSKQAACSVIGVALREKGPSMSSHSATRWTAMCNTSNSPVRDDAVFVRGDAMGFDMPREYWPCGNCPDPLSIPISTLRDVLTSRMKSLLAD